MKRRFRILIFGFLTLLACFGMLAGCTLNKTFEKAGMQITLTSKFYEKDYLSMTAYYESKTAIVTVLKEEYTSEDVYSEYTLSEYADAVLRVNKIKAEKFEREGEDYLYFTYEKSVSGKDFYYLATTHRSDNAFWLIQFACNASDQDKFTDTFLGWADTVTFVSGEAL